MNDESYMIKKSHREKTGKDVHVFMTDGHSQVLDSKDAVYMKNLVEILNENTDNGCFYELITVKNYIKKK
jgi:hypothetical protein|tara:strand:+ start:620 stop:829 length:210 start_codon:yes stop_codon:yes gene_type:complete